MASGRLGRFVGGLGLGYLQTLVVLVVGLWLTPYLLRELGQHDYGLWLLASQVLVYLALMDLGIVALVPREVAFAVGQRAQADAVGAASGGGVAGAAAATDEAGVRQLMARTVSLVLWQTPVVAAAALAAVWLIPAEWEPLRWPFVVVAAAFVLSFPLRVFSALLQGLQDLTYLGVTQLAGWTAGTATTVVGVFAGFGLYSLAAGWVVAQFLPAVMAWRRVTVRHPGALPSRLLRLSWSEVRRQLGRGTWISVSQVAQVLLSGTDIIVIGKLLGPEAIVPYACTGKLVALLANQPQLFMQMALPALSEMRGAAARQRLFDVSRSMTQVMLLASGAIVVAVLVVNEPFVRWWVGETRFGGTGLTALLLAGMLARHVNVTAIYTLFCFGYERRLALTSIADGIAGVAAMAVLVPMFGAHGAAAGLLVATLAVSLPCNALALAREQGTSPVALARSILPWFVRFVAVLAAAVGLAVVVGQHGFWSAAPLVVAVGALYAAIMIPVLRMPPLGPMVWARLQPLVALMPGAARRMARASLESMTP